MSEGGLKGFQLEWHSKSLAARGIGWLNFGSRIDLEVLGQDNRLQVPDFNPEREDPQIQGI